MDQRVGKSERAAAGLPNLRLWLRREQYNNKLVKQQPDSSSVLQRHLQWIIMGRGGFQTL